MEPQNKKNQEIRSHHSSWWIISLIFLISDFQKAKICWWKALELQIDPCYEGILNAPSSTSHDFSLARNATACHRSFTKPFRGRGSPQLRIYSQQIPDCWHTNSQTSRYSKLSRKKNKALFLAQQKKRGVKKGTFTTYRLSFRVPFKERPLIFALKGVAGPQNEGISRSIFDLEMVTFFKHILFHGLWNHPYGCFQK